jgi:hypothetical protein
MRIAPLIASAVLLVSVVVLAACGDKTPESEAAKEVGKIPKQTIDRAGANVTKALEQGAARNREAEEKNK